MFSGSKENKRLKSGMKYSFDLDNVMRILFYNSAHLTWIKALLIMQTTSQRNPCCCCVELSFSIIFVFWLIITN